MRRGENPEDSKELIGFEGTVGRGARLSSHLCAEAPRLTGTLYAGRVTSAFFLNVHHAEEGGGERLPPPSSTVYEEVVNCCDANEEPEVCSGVSVVGDMQL